jgi:steroid delta-isomerase-like uncharacterized protein
MSGNITKSIRNLAMVAALSLGSGAAMAQDALSVVQNYLAAWNTHDSTAAASFMVDDVSYFDATIGKPLVGRELAKTQIIDSFIQAVPDAKWSMVGDPVVTGENVAFEWTFVGTNSGDWADGTPATNKAFVLQGMSMFQITGDKIVRQADYYDALGFYVQLGLM